MNAARRRRPWLAWLPLFAVAGCAPALPPAREQDVAAALVRTVLRPMGDVLVVSGPSLCATDGETDAAIPASLLASYLAANASDAGGLAPAAVGGLRLGPSDVPPRRLAAERRETVVAVSRIGLAGDAALACLEVFGAKERGFLLEFARDYDGRWAVRAEHDAWQRQPMPWERAPEELPDGTPYRSAVGAG